MGPVILVHGPQGSGKGTQCGILAEKLRGVHISTGELLRQNARMASDIADGSLAKNEDIINLMGEALDSVPASQAIILDGACRMPKENLWLAEHLAKLGRHVDVLIYLSIPEEESIVRLTKRAKRGDDSPEAIMKRLAWTRDTVSEVVDYWRGRVPVVEVDGVGSVNEVAARIWNVVSDATKV